MQGDECVFVFDTDSENEEIFTSYDLSPVHEAAFKGKDAADIMNVEDEYGSFNTGAVPIWSDGQVVGIVCTDIRDEYMENSFTTAFYNAAILVGMLAATMLVTFHAVAQLLGRLKATQQKLQHQALYDPVTDLPNRQYLMDHLVKLTSAKARILANFKDRYLDRYIDKYAVGLGVGVALYPYHSDNYHVIIKYADMAMYAATQAGKNRYRIYSDELNREVSAEKSGG